MTINFFFQLWSKLENVIFGVYCTCKRNAYTKLFQSLDFRTDNIEQQNNTSRSLTMASQGGLWPVLQISDSSTGPT